MNFLTGTGVGTICCLLEKQTKNELQNTPRQSKTQKLMVVAPQSSALSQEERRLQGASAWEDRRTSSILWDGTRRTSAGAHHLHKRPQNSTSVSICFD